MFEILVVRCILTVAEDSVWMMENKKEICQDHRFGNLFYSNLW